MKKNIYYRMAFGRGNFLKATILSFALSICSWPRLTLEVFIRKNFGEQYFTFASALTVFFILLVLPFMSYVEVFLTYGSSIDIGTFLIRYTTWYAFAAAFLYFSYQRDKEIKREPSVFDFAKYSLSSGIVEPYFLDLISKVGTPDRRKRETLYEPAPFFVAGVLLWFIGQPLGSLLFFCSVIYSISYVGAYVAGDMYIMNMIDDIILNEEKERIFLDDADPKDTRGVDFRGRKLATPDMRKRLLSHMNDDEAVEAK